MRSTLLFGACAASILLALSAPAAAADVEAAPEPQGWGWYVSVFGGWSVPDDLDLSFDGVRGSSTVDIDLSVELDDGFMAGIAVGAQFNEWLRGEVELSGHWHDVDDEATFNFGPNDSYVVDLEGDVNAQFVLANLWVDFPVGGTFRPYAGGGVGLGRMAGRFFTCTPGKPAKVIRSGRVVPRFFSNHIKCLSLTVGWFCCKTTNLKLKAREVIVTIFPLVAAH